MPWLHTIAEGGSGGGSGDVLAEGDLDVGDVLGEVDFRGGFPGDLDLPRGVFGFGVAFFFGVLILAGFLGVAFLRGRLKRSEVYSPDGSGWHVLISLTIQWGRRQLKGV